jgi:hypothetical protein
MIYRRLTNGADLRDPLNTIAGPRGRMLMAILIASALAASLLGAHLAGAAGVAPVKHPNPCNIRRLHLRCPDLIMSEPSEMEMDRSTEPGRVLLRATSSVNNHGSGPMELRAKRTGKHRWRVYQAIYDRRGNVHLFHTKANLVFKFVPGERYGIGNLGDASYWKLQHAAGFQLWSINRHFKAIRLVRTGPKVDYCLRDLERTDPKPGSPDSAHYPGCNQDPGLKHDMLGTSVGWSDIYPYSYPQQWIDVTGLQGRFAYVQIADPDHYFHESNHRNDLSETYIDLPSGRVIGHRTGVARP